MGVSCSTGFTICAGLGGGKSVPDFVGRVVLLASLVVESVGNSIGSEIGGGGSNKGIVFSTVGLGAVTGGSLTEVTSVSFGVSVLSKI